MSKYYCSSKKCKTCKYRTSESAMNRCDYIFIIGHSRGCDPGDKCTTYKRGNRISYNQSYDYKATKLNLRGNNNDHK